MVMWLVWPLILLCITSVPSWTKWCTDLPRHVITRHRQLYNGKCGENVEMCTTASSGQCTGDSADGKAERNGSVDLIYNVERYKVLSVDCAAIITM